MTFNIVRQKRLTHELLSRNLLSKDVLRRHCALDYGRHRPKPKENLGDIGMLPTELQHMILRDVDLESLLRFRQVNHQAMETVDSMLEWKKVLTHAADTIRMAVGSHTASTFTIGQLFDKLCQKHCDFCSRSGPYINMFTLHRRCFDDEPDRSPSCTSPYVTPFHLKDDWYYLPIRSSGTGQIREFVAIPNFYSANETGVSFVWKENRDYFTVLVAPWLSPTSMDASFAIVCINLACKPSINQGRVLAQAQALLLLHGSLEGVMDIIHAQMSNNSKEMLRNRMISELTIYTQEEIVEHNKTHTAELQVSEQGDGEGGAEGV